jgi:DNA-binding response OmpR family regulator
MKILVCEDQDAIRHMIETLVSASGHEVLAVENGPKAVEAALAGPFDVMLLDLMLPGGLDGFGVCERLRAEEATRAMPIIIISALDDDDTRARARKAGATAFYAKPFSPLALLKDIAELAERRP